MGESAASLDDVLSAIKPKMARVKVCLRGDLIDELEQLEAAYREAKKHDEGDLGGGPWVAIENQIAEVQAEVARTEVEFVFEAIGQRPWRDIIAQHPPTPEGKKRGEEFNPETFPFAAISVSCIQPSGMTIGGAEKLYERLNFGQWNQVWGACLQANVATTAVPRSAAASATRRASAES